MEPEFKYWAFISYSHKDRTWGEWLHKTLEGFRTPWRLAGRPSRDGTVPKRIYPVFRDREELPGAADLGDNINDALRRSRYLIVICSPHAAVSKWVDKEAQYFKSLGREDRVLCLIVGGTPHAAPDRGELECFPTAVRYRVGADGALTDEGVEPIAPDARPEGDGRAGARLKLIAGLLGVNYDDLRRRDLWRRRRRRIQWSLVAAAALGWGVHWWLEPGTVQFEFKPPPPPGLTLRVDDQPLGYAANQGPLRLPAGRHHLLFEAPKHYPFPVSLDLARQQKITTLAELRHYQGTLDVQCTPPGSTIEINGLAYGSPIPNLPQETGTYRLLAWNDGYLQSNQTVQITRDQRTVVRFSLEKGLEWEYSSPAIQGGLVLLPDAKVAGAPLLAHNELDRIIFLSTADGSVVGAEPTPAGNTRTFREVDLGGEVGRVMVSGYDAEGGGPEVVVLKTAPQPEELWRWTGPARGYTRSQGLAIVPAPNAGGTSDLAVAGRDGHLYLLEGKTGEQRQDITLFSKPLIVPPEITPWRDGERTCFLAVLRPGDPDAPPAGAAGVVAVSVDRANGAVLWHEQLPGTPNVWTAAYPSGAIPLLVSWDDHRWEVRDAKTGAGRGSGLLPAKLNGAPLPAGLEGPGVLDLVLEYADPAQAMEAVRVSDAATVWRGPAGLKAGFQPRARDGSLLCAPGGEILIVLADALAAVDPHRGDVVWRAAGNPRGVLVGDWDGDGSSEILVTMIDEGLVCLDRTGRVAWILRLDQDVEPWALLPAADGVGTRDILIHRHAALIGAVHGPRTLWQAGASAPLQAAPVVAAGDDGRPLVVGLGPWGNDVNLRGFDAATGTVRWSVSDWFAPNRGPALADIDGNGISTVVAVGHPLIADHNFLMVYRASDGKLLRAPGVATGGWLSCTPAVADYRGTGKCDVAYSTWDDRSIVLVDGRSGELLWRQPTAGPNMGGITAADLDGDGLPDVVASSFDGHLYAVRGRDGHLLWKAPVAGGAWSVPVVADLDGDHAPKVLVVSMAGRLSVLDGRTGELIWSPRVTGGLKVGGQCVVAREGGRTLLLAPLGGAGVVAFDWIGRNEAWRSPAGYPVIASPVVADLTHGNDRQVVVATATGDLWVLDLGNGKPRWHTKIGRDLVEADPVVADLNGDGIPDILVADHDFHLYVVNGRIAAGAPAAP